MAVHVSQCGSKVHRVPHIESEALADSTFFLQKTVETETSPPVTPVEAGVTLVAEYSRRLSKRLSGVQSDHIFLVGYCMLKGSDSCLTGMARRSALMDRDKLKWKAIVRVCHRKARLLLNDIPFTTRDTHSTVPHSATDFGVEVLPHVCVYVRKVLVQLRQRLVNEMKAYSFTSDSISRATTALVCECLEKANVTMQKDTLGAYLRLCASDEKLDSFMSKWSANPNTPRLESSSTPQHRPPVLLKRKRKAVDELKKISDAVVSGSSKGRPPPKQSTTLLETLLLPPPPSEPMPQFTRLPFDRDSTAEESAANRATAQGKDYVRLANTALEEASISSDPDKKPDTFEDHKVLGVGTFNIVIERELDSGSQALRLPYKLVKRTHACALEEVYRARVAAHDGTGPLVRDFAIHKKEKNEHYLLMLLERVEPWTATTKVIGRDLFDSLVSFLKLESMRGVANRNRRRAYHQR